MAVGGGGRRPRRGSVMVSGRVVPAVVGLTLGFGVEGAFAVLSPAVGGGPV